MYLFLIYFFLIDKNIRTNENVSKKKKKDFYLQNKKRPFGHPNFRLKKLIFKYIILV